MWRLLQTLIIGLIVSSNIRYRWTPNQYVAVLLAIGLAYLATVVISWALDCWTRKKSSEKRSRARVNRNRALVGEITLDWPRHQGAPRYSRRNAAE